jgi:magnesium chelatase subunit I
VSIETTPQPTVSALGALRAGGHEHRSVRAEIRTNLLALLASGGPRFPGIVGFGDTVLPQLERALIAATTSCCSASGARARRG